MMSNALIWLCYSWPSFAVYILGMKITIWWTMQSGLIAIKFIKFELQAPLNVSSIYYRWFYPIHVQPRDEDGYLIAVSPCPSFNIHPSISVKSINIIHNVCSSLRFTVLCSVQGLFGRSFCPHAHVSALTRSCPNECITLSVHALVLVTHFCPVISLLIWNFNMSSVLQHGKLIMRPIVWTACPCCHE